MGEADVFRLDAINERPSGLETAMENELTEQVYMAFAYEVESLEAERLDISRRPRIVPAELASRVGTFLTLSHTGEMQLDDDYSERPLQITMLKDEAEVGADADDEIVADETPFDDTSDDSEAPTGGHKTSRIEETPMGGDVRTVGGKSIEVDPDNAAPDARRMSRELTPQLPASTPDTL